MKKNGKRTIAAAIAVMLVMACALFALAACDETSTLGTKDERSDPAYVEFGMFPQDRRKHFPKVFIRHGRSCPCALHEDG